MTTSQSPDWRENILRDLPEGPIPLRGATFPSALEVIKVAAYNRRMSLEDFAAELGCEVRLGLRDRARLRAGAA